MGEEGCEPWLGVVPLTVCRRPVEERRKDDDRDIIREKSMLQSFTMVCVTRVEVWVVDDRGRGRETRMAEVQRMRGCVYLVPPGA